MATKTEKRAHTVSLSYNGSGVVESLSEFYNGQYPFAIKMI